LNAVFSDAVDGGASTIGVRDFDNFGIDGGANSFEDGLAGAFGGEVDGASALPVEGDVGLVGGDDGLDGLDDITLGEVVRFEVVGAFTRRLSSCSSSSVSDTGSIGRPFLLMPAT
jgi:hypothetical protein